VFLDQIGKLQAGLGGKKGDQKESKAGHTEDRRMGDFAKRAKQNLG